MDAQAVLTAIVTGVVTGGGTLALIFGVGLKYAGGELAKVREHDSQIQANCTAVARINGDLGKLQASTGRIEVALGEVRQDVAYLKGRFEEHD